MPTHEEIALAAYRIWEANPDSDAEGNWLTAEAQLLSAVPDNELLESLDVVNLAVQSPIVRG